MNSNKELQLKHVRDLLFSELQQFYNDPRYQEKCNKNLEILGDISLRGFEPMMSKFICEVNQCYLLEQQQKKDASGVNSSDRVTYIPVNPLSLFDKMIKHYAKQLFDIFARHTPLSWTLSNGTSKETSYCQMNYIKFLTEYDLMSRLLEYYKRVNMSVHKHEQEQQQREDTEEGKSKKGKGKNYYMKRTAQPQQVILFDMEQACPLPKPAIPAGAHVLRGIQHDQQWQQACMQQLSISHSIQPIRHRIQDMSAAML